jgi:DNA-directed RNA polymerase subunit RPC12/RpoP
VKCWHCRSEVIWSGDYDISEEDEEYDMMTELSCPECNSIIIVYYPKEEKE